MWLHVSWPTEQTIHRHLMNNTVPTVTLILGPSCNELQLFYNERESNWHGKAAGNTAAGTECRWYACWALQRVCYEDRQRGTRGGVLLIYHFLTLISFGKKKIKNKVGEEIHHKPDKKQGVLRLPLANGHPPWTHTDRHTQIHAIHTDHFTAVTLLYSTVGILSVSCFPSCSLPVPSPVVKAMLLWQLGYMMEGAPRWAESGGQGGKMPTYVCMTACMHSGGGLRLEQTVSLHNRGL